MMNWQWAMAIADMLIIFGIVIALSIACSILTNEYRRFSITTFLSAMAVCVLILVWVGVLQNFFIVISLVAIVATWMR